MPMTDYAALIPSDKEKPSIPGQRYKAWLDLDRPTLMGLLNFIRQRYLATQKERISALDEVAAIQEKHALELLQEVRAQTLELFEKVPDELFNTVPEGETWSFHDLANHLAVDEDGEFFPGPPDSLFHRLKNDILHLAQLRRFLQKLKLIEKSKVEGAAK